MELWLTMSNKTSILYFRKLFSSLSCRFCFCNLAYSAPLLELFWDPVSAKKRRTTCILKTMFYNFCIKLGVWVELLSVLFLPWKCRNKITLEPPAAYSNALALWYKRPLNQSVLYSKLIDTPRKHHFPFFHQNSLTWLSFLKEVKPSPGLKMTRLLAFDNLFL